MSFKFREVYVLNVFLRASDLPLYYAFTTLVCFDGPISRAKLFLILAYKVSFEPPNLSCVLGGQIMYDGRLLVKWHFPNYGDGSKYTLL